MVGHGFQGDYAERFGNRGHDKDVSRLVNRGKLVAVTDEAGKEDAMGNAQPSSFHNELAFEITVTGDEENGARAMEEHFGGGFEEVVSSFLDGESTDKEDNLISREEGG